MRGICEACGREAELMEYTRRWFGEGYRTSQLCSECLARMKQHPAGRKAVPPRARAPKREGARTSGIDFEASGVRYPIQSKEGESQEGSGLIEVDYAVLEAWKQRAEYAATAEKLARQSARASLRAARARGLDAWKRVEEAQKAAEAAAQAAREAEKVWTETAAFLRRE